MSASAAAAADGPAPGSLLILHVSGSSSSSSRLLSAAYMDVKAREMSLGFVMESTGTSVGAGPGHASSLRLLLQQFAPSLAAAAGAVTVFVDEKRLMASERNRLNAQLSELQTELGSVPIHSGVMARLPSVNKSIDDVRRTLARMLQGGLQPYFTILDAHTPTLTVAQADMSLACLAYALQLHRAESANSDLASTLGHWQLTRVQLGAGTKTEADVDMATAQPIFMELDPAAQQALNLFPTASDHDKNQSLLGLLSKGRTPMSARRLETWIKQPLTNLDEITRRQNFVQLLMEDSELRNQLFETHLKKIADVDSLIKKLQDQRKRPASAHIQILVSLYNLLDRVPQVIGALQQHDSSFTPLLQSEFITPLQIEVVQEGDMFMQLIRTTIDLKATQRHEYRVLSQLNDELKKIEKRLDDCEQEIDDLVQETAQEMGLETSKVKKTETPVHGWVFRVSRKDEKEMRSLSGYKTHETRKDGVYFSNEAMRSASVALKAAKQAFDEEQSKLVDKCMEVTQTYLEVFIRLNDLLTEIDCFLALAHVAANAPVPYVRPTMLPMGSDTLEMVEARHPCIEALNSVHFIPNTINMQRDTSSVQIITGPNMGGKSTYIRQAGVICVMAQIGSFVPCTSARLTIVDSVLARVGAGDSQQKGVSTFMSEMLEAGSIIKSATANSLVIIDELGRGTSTYDGFGLAWAITESLATETKCFAFFATHFAELTALAQTHTCVKNLHVTAHTDKNQITMLYNVRPGVSDRSFGVHVADVANFPPVVVEMARQKASQLEAFGGDVQSILQHDQRASTTPAAAAAAFAGEPSSSPASSQDAPEGVRTLSGSKRVVADGEADITDVPDWMEKLLSERPSSDFKDNCGNINAEEMEKWVQSLEAGNAAPMEM